MEILAGIENAEFAIALKSPVSAANDVEAAHNAARLLMDTPSALFPPAAPNPHPGSGAGPLTSFAVLGQLLVAKGQIDAGDLTGADATLHGIRPDAGARALVSLIALRRARDALGLAAEAVDTGRATDATTQLETARSALAQSPTSGSAGRTALAAAIDGLLSQSGGAAGRSAGQIRNLEGQADALLTAA